VTRQILPSLRDRAGNGESRDAKEASEFNHAVAGIQRVGLVVSERSAVCQPRSRWRISPTARAERQCNAK